MSTQQPFSVGITVIGGNYDGFKTYAAQTIGNVPQARLAKALLLSSSILSNGTLGVGSGGCNR